MRDEDLTTPAEPQQTIFGDTPEAPPPASAPPASAAPELTPAEPTPEEVQAAELSRAAREAVRQPADPRIDRQLARMGLATDEAPTPEDGARVPARVVRAEDLARLEDELAEAREAAADAQARLGRADRRLQQLTWAVTIEGIAVALLAVLLLVR
jgi:hypothetical protein